MKIVSMNVHSLIETEEEEKLQRFARMVLAEQPAIIGLQEVNQTWNAPVVGGLGDLESREDLERAALAGYVACKGRGERHDPVLLRRDNYALRLAGRLRQLGAPYHWTWIPVKLGYGKYDEGLALFSRTPILDTDHFFISRSQAYENWKTREILGIQTQAEGHAPFWAYTVHMGWWDDKEEPFRAQWERVEKGLEARSVPIPAKTEAVGSVEESLAGSTGESAEAHAEGPVLWLMGDFNSPAQVRGEGYDLVTGWGWKDTYLLAGEKDRGITVEGEIDGWRERMEEDGAGEDAAHGMRIDYIWCSRAVPVARSQTICDGRRYPKVSDHNGVMVTIL